MTEVVPLLRRRADRARQHARAARALVAFHVPFVRPLVVVEMPRVAMPRARVSLLSTTPRRLATSLLLSPSTGHHGPMRPRDVASPSLRASAPPKVLRASNDYNAKKCAGQLDFSELTAHFVLVLRFVCEISQKSTRVESASDRSVVSALVHRRAAGIIARATFRMWVGYLDIPARAVHLSGKTN